MDGRGVAASRPAQAHPGRCPGPHLHVPAAISPCSAVCVTCANAWRCLWRRMLARHVVPRRTLPAQPSYLAPIVTAHPCRQSLPQGGPGGGFDFELWATLEGTTVLEYLGFAADEAKKDLAALTKQKAAAAKGAKAAPARANASGGAKNAPAGGGSSKAAAVKVSQSGCWLGRARPDAL